ncbi:MAG: patatin-like phospholipase family protein, partial [Acidobacteriota bacterium]|nr:patatin-like phospholipase family protein [Acidobacteriota bacterium]
FGTANALDCPFTMTDVLAKTATRLKKLDTITQDRIINWGYAVSDAAVRKYYDAKLSPPARFPYPAVGVG